MTHNGALVLRAAVLGWTMLAGGSLRAELRLPRVLSNHMVLQRDAPMLFHAVISPARPFRSI